MLILNAGGLQIRQNVAAEEFVKPHILSKLFLVWGFLAGCFCFWGTFMP